MNDRRRTDFLHGAAVAALVAACVAGLGVRAGPPPVPATPAAVDGLVAAKRFELDSPFRFGWSADRPWVDRGWILVLDVDPALAWPRESAQPVLYVEDRTAMFGPVAPGTGRLVAIVPGDVDLTRAAIRFGEPGLPERVDAERIARELAAARDAGIGPVPATQRERALRRGGGTARLESWIELDAVGRALLDGLD